MKRKERRPVTFEKWFARQWSIPDYWKQTALDVWTAAMREAKRRQRAKSR